MEPLKLLSVLTFSFCILSCGRILAQESATAKSQPGLIVTAVTAGSTSEKAGLKIGDRIVMFDGVPMRFASQTLSVRDEAIRVGKKSITMVVQRGDQGLVLSIAIAPLLGYQVRPPLPPGAQRLFDEARNLSLDQRPIILAKLKAAAALAETVGDARASIWLWREGASVAPFGSEEQILALNTTVRLAEIAGDMKTVVWAINDLGGIAHNRNRPAEAESLFKRALSINERLYPESIDFAGSQFNLGNVSMQRGALADAEQYYRRALAIWDRLIPGSSLVANCLTDLSFIVFFRGRSQEAEVYGKRALAMLEKLAPESGGVSNTLTVLGLAAAKLYGLDEAEKLHKHALAIREVIAPDSPDVVDSLNNLGYLARNRRQFDVAEAYYRRSIAITERLAPGSHALSQALGSMGSLYRERGKLNEAEAYYTRAESILDKLAPNSLDRANIILNLQGFAEARGQLATAETLGLRAWKIVQLRANQAIGDANRQTFRQDNARFASSLIRLQLQLGKTDAALVTLEEGRAQAMIAAIAERGISEKIVPASLWAAYKSARVAHSVALKELEAAGAIEAHSQRKLNELRTQRATEATVAPAARAAQIADADYVSKRNAESVARGEMESCWASVRRSVGSAVPEPRNATSARKLLKAGDLLLEFFVGDSKVVLFAAERASIRAFLLPLGIRDMESQIEIARNSVSQEKNQRGTSYSGASPPTINPNDVRTALRTLFNNLFPPDVQSSILRAKRIIISPDDILWDLPFAALITNRAGDPAYLGLEKPLSYTQSLAIYLQPKRVVPHITGTLIVGNPLYDNNRRPVQIAASERRKTPIMAGNAALQMATADRGGELTKLTRDGTAPEQLPGAETEVRQIAALYHTAAHIGVEPTERWFRSRLAQARVIHLATHGFLNQDSAQSSGVLLAVPEKAPPPHQYDNDGTLQAWEVWSLKLNADLVVLSACETGRGAKVTGEGLIGLTRAWQFAGARTVVSSQWKVSDASTGALMVAFHRHLLAGAEKDEALRLAMNEVARSSRAGWSNPYHWAAFVLIGDPGRLQR